MPCFRGMAPTKIAASMSLKATFGSAVGITSKRKKIKQLIEQDAKKAGDSHQQNFKM